MSHWFVDFLEEISSTKDVIEIMLVPGQKPQLISVRNDAHPFSDPSSLPIITEDLVNTLCDKIHEGFIGLNRSRWRATRLVSAWGTVLILRRIDHLFSFERFPEVQNRLHRYLEQAERRFGVHLIVGPVGSGKSALLSAFVYHMLMEGRSIILFEDPPEFDYSKVLNLPGSLVLVRGGIERLKDRAVVQGILRMMDTHDVIVGEARVEDLPFLNDLAMMGKRIWTTLHAVEIRAVWSRLHPFSMLEGVIETRLIRTPEGPIPIIGILYLPEFSHLKDRPDYILERWEETTDLPVSMTPEAHAVRLELGHRLKASARLHPHLHDPSKSVHDSSMVHDSLHLTTVNPHWVKAIQQSTDLIPPIHLTVDVLWDGDEPFFDGWTPEEILRWRTLAYSEWMRFVHTLKQWVLKNMNGHRYRRLSLVVLGERSHAEH